VRKIFFFLKKYITEKMWGMSIDFWFKKGFLSKKEFLLGEIKDFGHEKRARQQMQRP